MCQPEPACGWTPQRYDAAKALILKIREAHDRELTSRRPHPELIVETSAHVRANELAQSLEQGWTLARDAQPAAALATPLTPVTRLAPPLRLVIPRRDGFIGADGEWPDEHGAAPIRTAKRRDRLPLIAAVTSIAAVGILVSVVDSGAFLGNVSRFVVDTGRVMAAAMNRGIDPEAATAVARSPERGAGRESPTSRVGPLAPEATATPETMAVAEGPPDRCEHRNGGVGSAARSRRYGAGNDRIAAVSGDAAITHIAARNRAGAACCRGASACRRRRAVPSSSARAGKPSSPPPSASPRMSGSRGRLAEAYRSKPVTPPLRVAKAAPSPPSTLASASHPRPPETPHRTQLAAINKAPL